MPLDVQPASIRFGTLFLAVLVAGLAAGFLAATFHAAVTEPIIDQAITLEEMRHTGEPESEPVVPRDVQKVGLFVGWLVLGLVYAALMGASFTIARTRGWLSPGWFGAPLLAVGAYAAIALFPALKYPANPPGVGDPETIGFRQATFVACWVLGLLGAILAPVVASRLPLARARRVGVAVFVFAAWLLALYVTLPPNPDAVTMPLEIVSAFRVRSVEGLTIFWTVLGVTFAAFSTRIVRGPSAA